MNILDIILLVCFVPAIYIGLKKGFIEQVMAIISIIVGVWASARFANMVGNWLSQYINGSEQIMKITAFALILIAVMLGLAALGKLLEGMFKLVMLGWLNKLLGVIFALLKTTLIVGLVIMAFSSLNDTFHLVKETTLNKSAIYPVLEKIAFNIFPYLKDLLTLK